MNVTTIAGNVGNVRGPNDANGKRVLNFSVAVNEGRDRTTWFDCALWGDRADKLAPYIQKGGKVTVSGRVSGDVYEGNPKLKLFVLDVTLQGSKGDVQQSGSFNSVEQGGNVNASAAADFDDDIPF